MPCWFAGQPVNISRVIKTNVSHQIWQIFHINNLEGQKVSTIISWLNRDVHTHAHSLPLLIVFFCGGPLVLHVLSSCTSSTAAAQSLTGRAREGLRGGVNSAGCCPGARAPAPAAFHPPGGLLAGRHFPLCFPYAEGKLNIWCQSAHVPAAADVAAARVLQSFWGPFQWSSAGRRKVRAFVMWHLGHV